MCGYRLKLPQVSWLKKSNLLIGGLSLLALSLVTISGGAWYLLGEHSPLGSRGASSQETLPLDRFPVGVDPERRLIVENPAVEDFVATYLPYALDRSDRFLTRLVAALASRAWVQQLASVSNRTLVIYAGERHEEVVKNFGDILGWSKAERAEFKRLVSEAEPTLFEGKFFPGRYVVPRGSQPELVASLVNQRFSQNILSRYDHSVALQVPLSDALTIASLLEREAYDFADMRVISGIIWNRLFIDMPLQLDASLQYARGSRPSEPRWWPAVRPNDKFIDSPFNTYQEKGLPPTPISNPSVAAVVAALNPKSTECLFYFHDRRGGFYCTETYEEHVKKLNEVYGLSR